MASAFKKYGLMTLRTLLFWGLLCCSSVLRAQTISASQPVWSKKQSHDLKKKLKQMDRKDQKVRGRLIRIISGRRHDDSALVKKVINKMKLIDSVNYYPLRDLFQQYGFLNYDLVGPTGSLYFWVLVQHQDRHPQFQDSVLTAMKVQVDSGKASKTLYAYLTDRVNINKGELQVYGTQTKLNADSTSYEPLPCIDPEHLDERRKSVGLGPIAAYIASINKSNLSSPARHKKKQ